MPKCSKCSKWTYSHLFYLPFQELSEDRSYPRWFFPCVQLGWLSRKKNNDRVFRSGLISCRDEISKEDLDDTHERNWKTHIYYSVPQQGKFPALQIQPTILNAVMDKTDLLQPITWHFSSVRARFDYAISCLTK